MHGPPKPRVRPRHIKTFSPVLKTSRLPHLREAFRNLGDPPASQMERNVIQSLSDGDCCHLYAEPSVCSSSKEEPSSQACNPQSGHCPTNI
jgi:hypothetical protein